MLSHKILNRQDVSRLASYYEDSADDYYAKEGEASEWQGKGAQILDLHGPVDSNRFREILSGEVRPEQGAERKSTRKDSKARSGIDLTFSAPKSVSLQALVAGDVEIIKAHDRAVAKAVEHIEQFAQAREKIAGVSRVENTGNLIVAKFRHETSRERDPQLHTHAVVANLTQRGDGEWRALTNDRIVQSTKYLGAIYRAELAHGLSELGYELRHGRDGMFELAHISDEQLKEFSQRSAQIEDKLAAQGLNRETASAAEKQQAAMQTRAPKVAEDREAIFKEWTSRAKELEMDFDRTKDHAREKGEPEKVRADMARVAPDIAARKSVDYAIKHLTERQAIMSKISLLDTAIKHGIGMARDHDIEREIHRLQISGYLIESAPRYAPAAIAGAIHKELELLVQEKMKSGKSEREARDELQRDIDSGRLVPNEPAYTTQTAIEREKRILQIERDTRGKVEPVMSPEHAQERLKDVPLNVGQRSASEMILTTPNLVNGIQGYAGVGKSHMVEQTQKILIEQGYSVRALAPYGSQVKALRELGVESNTLASFLYAKDKKIDNRTVLILDEAGVVPTRQMEQMLQIAEKFGARVILLGDVEQTKAIEAGRPFDQLQVSGMNTATIDEILRQHAPELKKAVELSAHRKPSESLEHIQDIYDISEAVDRHSAIAKDYAQLSVEDREKTIIVTGTNESRHEINSMVRDELGLAGTGVTLDTLDRQDTTQAERRYSKHYQVGQLIQPERDYHSGLKKGQLYKVLNTGPGNRLTVIGENKQKIEFSPLTHTQLSVYKAEKAELAIGDVVRITRNYAKEDLANGDRMKVIGHKDGVLVLQDKNRVVELPTNERLHLTHAYAATVHSAQGLTQDRVLVNVDTKSLTTARDVWYVAISRARLQAKI